MYEGIWGYKREYEGILEGRRRGGQGEEERGRERGVRSGGGERGGIWRRGEARGAFR